MTSTRRCSNCGARLPKSQVRGLCPRCLLRLASPDSESSQPGGSSRITRSRDDPFEAGPGETGPGVALSGVEEAESRLPGEVLAGRYRLVAQLGRGAMGEVYRADDRKLGQPVALKLLPEKLRKKPGLLQRFFSEVKLARQVAHPNVCRVYDAGEADGQHFLTMEYVDGEDLASLLKRIGRAPKDKARQIACQLCAGLTAIHAEGILHRDLKPANVMLDGRGQVRITDFGVAGWADRIPEGEICGTPEYMSPEQLAGEGASTQSDLYSLGLMLFEILTGRRAFPSVDVRLREETTPPDPSQIVEGTDPAVARAVRQCLQPDPRDRPHSAAEVFALLAAGDPFKALLGSEDTPAPEMVAAAGARGGLGLRPAAALMGTILVGVFLIALAADRVMLFRHMKLDRPPEVLVHTARDLMRSIGYPEMHTDSAYGFGHDEDLLRFVASKEDPSGWDRLKSERLPAMYFWYRQSSGSFLPRDRLGRVGLTDPNFSSIPGATVVLDPQGRLLELRVGPPPARARTEALPDPDWGGLFTAAGLQLDQFASVTPGRIPPVSCETCLAWEGADAGGTPLYVEAGSYAGKPVFFRKQTPWGPPVLERPVLQPQFSQMLFNALCVIVILGCLVGARRNLRKGRGDLRGARRLALYVLAISMIQWLLRANHLPRWSLESELFVSALGLAISQAIFLCWLPYVTLEPYIRRRWPQRIVSWTRLLAGRFQDPLVARDVLIGLCASVVFQLMLRLYHLVPAWIAATGPWPRSIWPDTLLGPNYYISEFLRFQDNAIFYGLGLLFLLVLTEFLLKNEFLATAVVLGLMTIMWSQELSGLPAVLSWSLTGLRMAGFLLLLKRYGVLALIVAIFFDNFLSHFPVSSSLTQWYAEQSIFALTVVTGLSAYALYAVLRTDAPREQAS